MTEQFHYITFASLWGCMSLLILWVPKQQKKSRLEMLENNINNVLKQGFTSGYTVHQAMLSGTHYLELWTQRELTIGIESSKQHSLSAWFSSARKSSHAHLKLLGSSWMIPLQSPNPEVTDNGYSSDTSKYSAAASGMLVKQHLEMLFYNIKKCFKRI